MREATVDKAEGVAAAVESRLALAERRRWPKGGGGLLLSRSRRQEADVRGDEAVYNLRAGEEALGRFWTRVSWGLEAEDGSVALACCSHEPRALR